MKPIASSTLWRVALLATVLLALAARLVPGERTIDDAYITFRYARNLLAGEGFVYNPGQRVQGTTTPLYTVMLAAEKGALRGVPLPTLALVTNALADASSVVVLAWLGKRALRAPALGIAAGLLWALSPMSVTFSIGGMETSVYVLVLLLALACYAAGRSGWSAFWCALATLTRPDALLLVVPLFAHMVWERRRGMGMPLLRQFRTWMPLLRQFRTWMPLLRQFRTWMPLLRQFRTWMPLLRSRGGADSESWEGHPNAPERSPQPWEGHPNAPERSPQPREGHPNAPERSPQPWEGHPYAPAQGFPWIEMAIYGLTLAPWLLFATLYFGSPLAHSVVAKSAAYRMEPYSALVRLVQHYATPFFEHETLGTGWVAVGAVLYLFLSLVGGWAMVRRGSAPGTGARCSGGSSGGSSEMSGVTSGVRGRLLPLALYPWLYFLAFSLYNPLLFRWYLAPILPMYTLCILYGAHRLLGDLAGAVQRRVPAAAAATRRVIRARMMRARAMRAVEGLLLATAVGMLLNAWTLHPDHGPDRPAPEMAWFKLELLYRRATLDLMANQAITPETRIAAGDIGAIGYLSGARILDTVGLVSPEALGYYPLPATAYVLPYAISAGLLLDERPDYAILLEVYVRNTLQRSEAFAAAYEVYRRWPTDIYGSEGLLVYRKRGVGSRE